MLMDEVERQLRDLCKYLGGKIIEKDDTVSCHIYSRITTDWEIEVAYTGGRSTILISRRTKYGKRELFVPLKIGTETKVRILGTSRSRPVIEAEKDSIYSKIIEKADWMELSYNRKRGELTIRSRILKVEPIKKLLTVEEIEMGEARIEPFHDVPALIKELYERRGEPLPERFLIATLVARGIYKRSDWAKRTLDAMVSAGLLKRIEEKTKTGERIVKYIPTY